MKLRPIPEPIITPYPRKFKPELKSLVKVVIPDTKGKLAGNEPETKPAQKPSIPVKPQENREKSGNEPVPKQAPGKQKNEEAPPPVPEAEPMAVLEDGTVIPPPFRPVDPLTALASPDPTVAFVMLRQLQDMRGPMPDTSGGPLAVLDKLETGLKNGEDITVLNDEVAVHIMGEEEHQELFSRLSNSIDRNRAIEIFKSRAKWEDFCHSCMRRSDVTILEGMALMNYFNPQLNQILARIDKKMTKGDAPASRESVDLIDRVNRPTLLQNKQLQRKFDAASPQEREIIRKIGFKMEHALAARITKTTTETTETVEIVQPASDPT